MDRLGFQVITQELAPAGNGMFGKTKNGRKSGKGDPRGKEWNMIVLTWAMVRKESSGEDGRVTGKIWFRRCSRMTWMRHRIQ
jgi:hypothetical protein